MKLKLVIWAFMVSLSVAVFAFPAAATAIGVLGSLTAIVAFIVGRM